mgnify:FL=1
MEYATRDYIINTVFETNILPLTSKCNTSCVFCSHRQNPPGVEVFRLPRLSLDDFKEIIDFMSPDRKIVIGESATRIIEGEPLLHRDFLDIIRVIRQKFRKTPIQITTNGVLLDERIVAELVKLGNIELNISVNCVNPLLRRQVLGLKADNIRDKICMLRNKLRFSGSCVMVPEYLKWEDIEEIVALLNDNGADVVKIFLPGYTSMSGKFLDLYEAFKAAEEFVKSIRDKYAVPVIVEPSVVSNLECKVEGVIRNTPACKAGIKPGDVILKVNGDSVRTRVEAFDKVYRLSNPSVLLQRGERQIEVRLVKGRNVSPGFVVLWDADPDMAVRIKSTVKYHEARDVLFITSELAFNVIVKLFEISNFDFNYEVISAKNAFFGGNIKCAGLLTVPDVTEAAVQYLSRNKKPDLIMLPYVMFDSRKRDLLGKSIKEIEQQLGIPADTI